MTLATLTFPRDFSVLIVAAWIWLGFWTSAKPKIHQPDPPRWTVYPSGVEEGHGVLISELLKDDGPWAPDPKSKRLRLERFRNGWTFLIGTVLAVGLIVLIYATEPYMWTL